LSTGHPFEYGENSDQPQLCKQTSGIHANYLLLEMHFEISDADEVARLEVSGPTSSEELDKLLIPESTYSPNVMP
jgi:hypothetical protein